MPDYKEMYTILFNKIADVIEELQAVQRETERLYTDCNKREIVLLRPKNHSKDRKSGGEL